MQSQNIHIKVSLEMLERIDEAAAESWQSRSDYVRQTIALRLNRQDIINQPDPDDAWQKAIESLNND